MAAATDPARTSPSAARSPRAAALVPALVPVLALALAAVLGGCSAGSDGSDASTASGQPPSSSAASTAASASAAPAAEPSSAPAPSPSVPAATATAVGTATLDPVTVGERDDFGDGLTARVASLREQQLQASAPGEVSGPGVLVAIELQNGSPSPIDLDGLTVTVSYGQDQAASPSTSAPADVPTGLLAPGASASGTWAFSVPSGEADSVRVLISSTSSPNVISVTR